MVGYHSGVKIYAMFQIIFDEEFKYIEFVNSAGVVHYPAKLYPPQIWQMLHTAAPVHWEYPVPGRSVNRERAVSTHDLQCTVSVLRKRVVQCNTA